MLKYGNYKTGKQQHYRDLCDRNKSANIHINGVSRGKEKKLLWKNEKKKRFIVRFKGRR